MRRALDQLVRLADLRVALAVRGIAAARDDLRNAQMAAQAARQAAETLAHDQTERRKVLRSPLLGRPQLRGAIEGVLATFQTHHERESAALDAALAAETAIGTACDRLEQAQQTLLAAERNRDKRIRLRQPVLDALVRRRDANDEAEAEDRRFGGPT